MTVIWCDVLTPKHAWLFGTIGKFLKDQGHEIFITVREYERTRQIIEFFTLSYESLGKHGGGSLEDKLLASAKRVVSLTKYETKLDKRPDCVFSLMSPEAARVAFGLGIPHVCFNDTPHAIAVSKLVYPLSSHLIVPKCVSLQNHPTFGMVPQEVIQFDGVFEALWISAFTPDDSIFDRLELNKNQPIIVFRPEESSAAYLLAKDEVKNGSYRSLQIIEKILKKIPESQIVAFPRYKNQHDAIQKEFKGKVLIPERAVHGPNLMYFADLVISGGGTMSQEAALLGTPSICYFPLDFDVPIFLKEKGFPITRIKQLDEVVKYSFKILEDPQKNKQRDPALLKSLEDPKNLILNLVKDLGGG